ncbi:MAG TPA: sigma-54 dependent transcriptional regulator [Myxococcales bacterium]|nr:sigma-54 dependent transcriptional regulator [Myxococcales bacterium]
MTGAEAGPPRPRVVLVDDEVRARAAMAQTLERWGYEVAEAGDGAAALSLVRSLRPAVVLSDLFMPGHDGRWLLEEGLAEADDTAFVIVSGRAGIAEAVDVMKAGAFDFLPKPVDLRRLRLTLERAVDRRQSRREVERLRRELRDSGGEHALLGDALAMRELRLLIERVGPADSSAIVTGESGVGKELVARAIAAHSHRAAGPFVAINCAAVPANLLESEFFGHERGAFTGADSRKLGSFDLADGGTLFLDEIGELPVDLQAKLLRALEEHCFRRLGGAAEVKVDVRVLAATNRDLAAAVTEGRFRLDLLYRLNVITVRVPPLRERGDDVLLLAQHFLDGYRRRMGKQPATLAADARAALCAYPWPGNVRELRNVMERAAILVDGDVIRRRDLPEELSGKAAGPPPALPVDATLEQVEQAYLLETLRRCGGNQTKAAQRLGISARTLYNRLKRWGLNA